MQKKAQAYTCELDWAFGTCLLRRSLQDVSQTPSIGISIRDHQSWVFLRIHRVSCLTMAPCHNEFHGGERIPFRLCPLQPTPFLTLRLPHHCSRRPVRLRLECRQEDPRCDCGQKELRWMKERRLRLIVSTRLYGIAQVCGQVTSLSLSLTVLSDMTCGRSLDSVALQPPPSNSCPTFVICPFLMADCYL